MERRLTGHWQVRHAHWRDDAKPLRIGILTDIHAVEPWMPADRIHEIAKRLNSLKPDVVVLLGDYVNAKTGSKPNSKPPQGLEDRYAVLQRKVEDLERIHNEGKKAVRHLSCIIDPSHPNYRPIQHQTEVDRLKFELGRSQKASAEHVDRAEKLKKQKVKASYMYTN